MREDIYQKAIELRHDIHMHPELSNEESETKRRIIAFLKANTNLEITDRGKWFYAEYHPQDHGRQSRGSIAFRADMDAIKVFEEPYLPYASVNRGVAHKCGHDGHSAVLSALTAVVSREGADKDVYFIFQHAEETGDGAELCAELISEKQIDEVYGIHNLPGFEEGTLVLKEGTVNCASKGLEITFTGKSAHASQPEKGVNPAFAVSKTALKTEKLSKSAGYKGLVLTTIVQIDVGERAFGVSAHKGKLLLTIRGQIENEMNDLQGKIEDFAKRQAEEYGLEITIEESDVFPETFNYGECIEKIREIATSKGWKTAELKEPIRTSEDFGYFLKKAPGALIWLGAGTECAPLHSEDFDYNDNLIEKSVDIFLSLI